MKLQITEETGEIGKIRRIYNYDMRLDPDSPGFLGQFFEKREKALLRYSDLIRKVIESIE
ncbi:unnamed protein product [marine sediment metagenome]|uniref:Uncharacterized protein n=1 Tax=marine sediment metagenome TaxID=412755 RepID=X1G0Q9_9ZZZZ